MLSVWGEMGRKSSAKADRRTAAAARPAAPLTAREHHQPEDRQQEVLDEIARLDQLHRGTRVELGQAVDRARDLNVSWTVIGAALGVSRQAARRRFEGPPAQ